MPRYKVLAPGVIRTGAAKDSPKADPDKLTVGQEIDVLETQEVDGTTRLRFEGGWTSLTAKSGKVLLERVGAEPAAEASAESEEEAEEEPEPEPAEQPEPAEPDAELDESLDLEALEAELNQSDGDEDKDEAPTSGVRYKALAPGVIRTGSDMDSVNADPPKLTVGQEILVLERVTLEDGTVRLRFEGGWTSEKAKSGKQLVERLDKEDGEQEPEPKPEPKQEPEPEPKQEEEKEPEPAPDYSKMRPYQLKAECKKLGMSQDGSRDELIARLQGQKEPGRELHTGCCHHSGPLRSSAAWPATPIISER